ncbi:hypothetical protein FDP41_008204 [Naegleria fowleri]|uniref:Nudix hydrolase domain-containing protein n=1 Tax=Naegleria fowleri TaxID=5763 RepID=A0A6A5BHK7_NAEFO|nr:uncharacterized protein FDP41_008204 [Naegleria fowleri]KAF0973500.1 hypothetical protein FDP41_008204 [Naegleria fowleri]CAG4716248.1 unnamed protein product [Naegleria fowleri]
MSSQLVRASKHPFGYSIFAAFGISDEQNEIEKLYLNFCGRDDVILSTTTPSSEKNTKNNTKIIEIENNCFELKIGRHTKCPLKTTSKWIEKERIVLRQSLSTATRKFDFMQVAVAVLIENIATKEVLITKRAKHMRAFPNTYVVPGGSVEKQDESIYHAAARETFEETGIEIDCKCLKPIYLWESAFPTSIDQGIPSRHHLIIYLHAKVNLFSENASKEERYENILKLQKEEVESASWIGLDVVSQIVEHIENGREMTPKLKQSIEGKSFQVFDVNRTYSTSPLEVLFNSDNTIGYERLTTGTRFLLKRWYHLTSQEI